MREATKEELAMLDVPLNFGQALEVLNNGGRIKVPEWKGYWFKESGMVKVMTAEGQVLESPHFQQYIFRTDWRSC